MDKEVNKLEEDKDMATAALIVEVPEDSKVRSCAGDDVPAEPLEILAWLKGFV